ncbi:hypothetical protein FACS189415_0390 [Bacteroidia bacterium]|nr:hypothetical protein FACS189415_0390 [Bacteroidia bacterium]GHV70717.1 hypothetical protein FACS189420_2970 [Bacteroidia bacterium]
MRYKVFISSVQKEFAKERRMLYDYIRQDAFLGQFFEPFIFEKTAATNKSAQNVYLDKVRDCKIYLGIFGEMYGNEDEEGVSPTEREYDLATELHKTRLIFIKNTEKRAEKETLLIRKAETSVVRKSFESTLQLKNSVYTSLIRYLEENEIIRTSPFDATFNKNATLDDLSEEKIHDFTEIARAKRAFPFDKDTDIRKVLTHLNLINGERITNASVLLFGKNPQKFFITSEVKCAHFHGLPIQAVTEAIVNAVAHRDYTSNGSVQVMLFADRLLILNPGQLPFGLTIDKLYQTHNSIPANPLIAEAMYLRGTIERMGTGTEDLANRCLAQGLKKPDFLQEADFRTTLYRAYLEENVDDTGQVAGQVTEQVKRLLSIFKGTDILLNVSDIMNILSLRHRPTFLYTYLQPALEQEFIEMKYPKSPNHPKQRYCLTEKGSVMIKQIKR